jgi:hypothetical protein
MNRRERRAAKVKGKRCMRCPCGGYIVDDPATMTIRHSNPQCDAFVKGIAACGMKPFREEWAEVFNPITGELVEKAKA